MIVVDDSSTVRNVLGAVLRAQDWHVELAGDGTTGAAMALSTPPDAVVSDVFMPGLSGLQLCRLLHEDPLTAHVPVVLLSAAGQRRSRFWAARSGASAFLDKTRVNEIPALLETLIRDPALRGRRPAEREASTAGAHAVGAPATTVDAGAVPARLSTLLDGALFAAVVASEMRGLALSSVDLASLFQGVAALLTEMLSYRWMALSAETPAGPTICVHAPPDEAAVLEASRTFGMAGAPEVLLSDERCSRGRPGRPAIVRPIEHAGGMLGQIAIAFDDAGGHGDDEAVLELTARELALPLRLISVLEQTQRLAATDGLTGIANRRSGGEALARCVLEAERGALPLSVVMIDIDHFKSINDTHGHQAGDAVLQRVAAVLRRSARKADTIVRWGGEEFVAILRGTGAAGARVAGERLRLAIAGESIALPAGGELKVTASFGVASREADSPEQLVERADAALYDAKRRGRNRVEVAPPRVPSRAPPESPPRA